MFYLHEWLIFMGSLGKCMVNGCFFYGLYHGKSPLKLNYHLGEYVMSKGAENPWKTPMGMIVCFTYMNFVHFYGINW